MQGGRDSPKRSVSNVSGLFDVLVAAATGGEGNNNNNNHAQTTAGMGDTAATSKPGMMGPGGLAHRQKSRLHTALSYGDADSLQNALDAYQARPTAAAPKATSSVTVAATYVEIHSL